MTEVVIVNADPAHAAAIAADARQADIDELWAQGRKTPEEAMLAGIARSSFAVTALFDGHPVCMFGVMPGSALGGVGVPWMVAARLVEQHAMAFLRRCRPAVDHMAQRYPVLVNAVDARNTLAIGWLRWLGFTMKPAIPVGPDRIPFLPFEKRTHV